MNKTGAGTSPEQPRYASVLLLRRLPGHNRTISRFTDCAEKSVEGRVWSHGWFALGEFDYVAQAEFVDPGLLQLRAFFDVETRQRFLMAAPTLGDDRLGSRDDRLPWRSLSFLRLGAHFLSSCSELLGVDGVQWPGAIDLLSLIRETFSRLWKRDAPNDAGAARLRYWVDLGAHDLVLEIAASDVRTCGSIIQVFRLLSIQSLIESLDAPSGGPPTDARRWDSLRSLLKRIQDGRPYGHVFSDTHSIVGTVEKFRSGNPRDAGLGALVFFHVFPGHEADLHQCLSESRLLDNEKKPENVALLLGEYDAVVSTTADRAPRIFKHIRSREHEIYHGKRGAAPSRDPEFPIQRTLSLVNYASLNDWMGKGQKRPHYRLRNCYPSLRAADCDVLANRAQPLVEHLGRLGVPPELQQQAARLLLGLSRAFRDQDHYHFVVDLYAFADSLVREIEIARGFSPLRRRRFEESVAKSIRVVASCLGSRLSHSFGTHFAPGSELETAAAKLLAFLERCVHLANEAISSLVGAKFATLLTFGYSASQSTEKLLDGCIVINATTELLRSPAIETVMALHEISENHCPALALGFFLATDAAPGVSAADSMPRDTEPCSPPLSSPPTGVLPSVDEAAFVELVGAYLRSFVRYVGAHVLAAARCFMPAKRERGGANSFALVYRVKFVECWAHVLTPPSRRPKDAELPGPIETLLAGCRSILGLEDAVVAEPFERLLSNLVEVAWERCKCTLREEIEALRAQTEMIEASPGRPTTTRPASAPTARPSRPYLVTSADILDWLGVKALEVGQALWDELHEALRLNACSLSAQRDGLYELVCRDAENALVAFPEAFKHCIVEWQVAALLERDNHRSFIQQKMRILDEEASARGDSAPRRVGLLQTMCIVAAVGLRQGWLEPSEVPVSIRDAAGGYLSIFAPAFDWLTRRRPQFEFAPEIVTELRRLLGSAFDPSRQDFAGILLQTWGAHIAAASDYPPTGRRRLPRPRRSRRPSASG